MPAALDVLPQDLRPTVLHQAGRGDERVTAVRAAYAAAGIVAGGKAADLTQGVQVAAEAIDSGNALGKLDALKEVSWR